MIRTDSQFEAIPSDAEISNAATYRPIQDVAADLGLEPTEIERIGTHKAKVTHEAIQRASAGEQDGRLVLVTAMTPTRAGEGKTVTTVGLGQALGELGENAAVAIRQPSLGPIFGIKGGAAGGGYAQVVPMDEINVHFTGDIHAITVAHNLIAAMLDNHLHQGNEPTIDPDGVVWPRAMDMNDRALRNVVVGLGGSVNGVPREAEFVITAASELMAVVGMASDIPDLKQRVGRVIVASDVDGESVTVDDLEATGAVAAVLRDAIRPNLVQTLAGTPAFVHGGPFANIAHGTSSILADRLALTHAEYVVTEAGFGADLGAEKFFDIVSRNDLEPDAVVLVATVRALEHHGSDGLAGETDDSLGALRAGFENLDHHLDVLEHVGFEPVVAINRFPDDTAAELEAVQAHCRERGVTAEVSDVYRNGGEGGIELARAVRDAADRGAPDFEPLYDLEAAVREKIETIATEVYGADGVEFTAQARTDLEHLAEHGFDDLPVCISKVPSSLSDDPTAFGVPSGWTLSIRRLYPAAGPGFVVALTGDVMTMPGLPAEPAAKALDVRPDGTITGL
ncbi:formate--tetrahydrofolate ligase [Natronosalvus halobius]|uniref:formate--tetrahydrofolate ligase n=1 Tax=Natronosalvus halobius TaxID=2953746 RepID=UPI0020A03B22|nr:formate--tetrahydrofolate ligase [Natronosalvus halobius]USZ73061.1 formate--tetrahydrofolate ligase [Natronosalvus halobius]